VWSGQHLEHNAQRQEAPTRSTSDFTRSPSRNFFSLSIKLNKLKQNLPQIAILKTDILKQIFKNKYHNSSSNIPTVLVLVSDWDLGVFMVFLSMAYSYMSRIFSKSYIAKAISGISLIWIFNLIGDSVKRTQNGPITRVFRPKGGYSRRNLGQAASV